MYAVEIVGKAGRDLRSLRVLRISWRDLYIREQDYMTRGKTTNGETRNIRDTLITIEDALSKHRIARAHLSSIIHTACSHNLSCHSAESRRFSLWVCEFRHVVSRLNEGRRAIVSRSCSLRTTQHLAMTETLFKKRYTSPEFLIRTRIIHDGYKYTELRRDRESSSDWEK